MKKSLTLEFVGGSHESFNVEEDVAQRAVGALGTQEPAHPIRISEAVTVHVNMRQVATLAVGDAQEEPEEEEETPDPDPEHDPDRTVAQLKEALDAAQVEYPSTALKADLQALAQEHGV